MCQSVDADTDFFARKVYHVYWFRNLGTLFTNISVIWL